ncbi:MAG: hypothetical protein JJT96_19360 [Opitutales bacterium]|nr:hypothetical protein [Opitutales bacterium]
MWVRQAALYRQPGTAVLEHFQISRARAEDESKTLSASELERWFDRQLRLFGDSWLSDLEKRTMDLAKRFELR